MSRVVWRDLSRPGMNRLPVAALVIATMVTTMVTTMPTAMITAVITAAGPAGLAVSRNAVTKGCRAVMAAMITGAMKIMVIETVSVILIEVVIVIPKIAVATTADGDSQRIAPAIRIAATISRVSIAIPGIAARIPGIGRTAIGRIAGWRVDTAA